MIKLKLISIIFLSIFTFSHAGKIEMHSPEWAHDSADIVLKKAPPPVENKTTSPIAQDSKPLLESRGNSATPDPIIFLPKFDTSYAINLKTGDTTLIISNAHRMNQIQNDMETTAVSTGFMAIVTGLSIIVSVISIIVVANKK